MAEDTDFVALYDELGLGAECSLAEFKQAYRRRVAQLHPDHPDNSSDVSRLQRVNRLYAAAIEFQRIHGRLPGAVRNPVASSPRGEPFSVPHMSAHELPAVSGSASHWRYVLLIALLGLVLYWLAIQEPEDTVPDNAQAIVRPSPDMRRPAAEKLLAIGMDDKQVRKIQGEPFNSHEHRWEYGPSWILFDCGVVVDWYSSPLHPLRVPSPNPSGEATVTAALLRKC